MSALIDAYHRLNPLIRKYISFIGPGLQVAVAYIDPGNYSTSVAAGSTYGYHLLFAIFISNIFAVILQCLCIKLGTVTGLDLAENCQKHLPRWLNLTVYVFAEFATICTDLAEVVGTAVALNILFKIPLEYGICLTILDVFVILLAYSRDGSMKQVRIFEVFVSILVFLTFCCFVILLTKTNIEDSGDVWRGFLPISSDILEKNAIYLSLGILGATVMPHSLYLGSALVQPRLKEFDIFNNHVVPTRGSSIYKPSIHAIRNCLTMSYWELIISLCVVAVFINSSILIVAAAALFGKPDAEDADLLSIFEMLKTYVSPAAGFIFALAMLFSGQAAGIICTMAGQIVSEGFIQWTINPFYRRIVTRLICILPCMFMVIFSGRSGVSDILNASQVILSLILPFVSAPLIYFTCNPKIMTVESNIDNPVSDSTGTSRAPEVAEISETSALIPVVKSKDVSFANGQWMTFAAVLTWSSITILNFYLVIQFWRGEDIHF